MTTLPHSSNHAPTHEGGRFTPASVAGELIDSGFRIASADDRLYMYDERLGRYVPAESAIRREVTMRLGDSWKRTRADAVLDWFADSAPKLWPLPPLDRVNVRNGILHVHTGELSSHTPDFLSEVQIEAAWDPAAECPAIERFVSQVLPEDTADLFYQLAGLYVVPDLRFQKAVMLYGHGDNGKGVMIDLVRRFVGSRNVASVPLQLLADSPFGSARLYRKLLNTFKDIPERPSTDFSLFEALVDQDPPLVSAPRKYRGPIQFVPFARLLFSADILPETTEISSSFLDRWIILPFPNTFRGDDADPRLIESLSTPAELSGLLNRAVSAYRRILRDGCLGSSQVMRQAKREFDRYLDSALEFVDGEARVAPDADVPQPLFYKEYKTWCEEELVRPVSARRFSATVRSLDGVSMYKSNGTKYFAGIEPASWRGDLARGRVPDMAAIRQGLQPHGVSQRPQGREAGSEGSQGSEAGSQTGSELSAFQS